MRIVVTAEGLPGLRTYVVEAPEGATTGDLLPRLGLGPAPAQHDPGSGSARPLLHGYAAGAPPDPAPESVRVARVVVEAGPDAGAVTVLPPGRWLTVGRDEQNDLVVDDPGLSRRHLRMRHGRDGFEVEDLGSTNGVHPAEAGSVPPWPPGSRFRAGSSCFRLEVGGPAPASVLMAGGRLVVRPWPRAVSRPPVRELITPPRPRRRPVPPPSTWAWALPLVASGAAALVLRMPLLLVLGLLGPAMVLGQHLGDRRAARREHEQDLSVWETAAGGLASQLALALEDERRVRQERDPGLRGVVHALLPRPTTSLWARVGELPEVVLGEGRDVSGVTLDGVPVPVDDVPVTLALTGRVAVVGPPAVRDAAVRSWVLQLATSHPPGELSIQVDDQAPLAGWDLLAWLPHTAPHDGPGTPCVLRWGEDVVLADDVRDAPPGIPRVRLLGPASAVLELPGQPARVFAPTLLGLGRARVLARRLAALHDREASEATAAVDTTLGDLLPWPSTTGQVRAGWTRTADPTLAVPVGTDAEGRPVQLDLDRDGPHALVAGTTGSGKSELLRSMVTGLALRHPPDRLAFLLVDYKGGSSLGECARLPHSTGLVTDLDAHLAERVLTSLRAELSHREELLARAGARDLRDYQGANLARLVVVVDEFRVLAEEIPEFVDGLVRVATVGRSLGLHLVLATQRPGGVVTPDLRANVSLRVALRVQDVADSVDVLGCPDAADIPQSLPGRALLRCGAGPARGFQVAPVGGPARRTAGGAWSVQEVPDAWAGWRALHERDRPRPCRPALGDLPELIGAAAEEAGRRAPTVWLPPLPDTVTQEDVPRLAPQRDADHRPWALADRPDRQRREALVWGADHHVGVAGSPRTGRSTALASLAAAAARSWLYVLDPGGWLRNTYLATDPRVRAWVGPADRAHGLRVLEVLDRLVDERRARPAADAVPVVVLLDGWDRWVAEYAELDAGRGVDLLLRLLRDGPAAQVAVVVSGDRSLLTGRVSAVLPELWAMRLHDPTDLALAGLRVGSHPAHQPPGRAVSTRDGTVVQVLVPPATPPTQAPLDRPPPHVVSLPRRYADGGSWAVGGDAARPVRLPVGSVLVLGPPRSGVTSTLGRLHEAGPGGDGCPDDTTVLVGPGDQPEDLARRLARRDIRVVVVDDLHLLAGTSVEDLVLEWSRRTGGRLLVGGELDACVGLYLGLVPHVARTGTGIVLQPSSAQHGAPFGARLPLGDLRVPGRGVLVERGVCTRVQVAGP